MRKNKTTNFKLKPLTFSFRHKKGIPIVLLAFALSTVLIHAQSNDISNNKLEFQSFIEDIRSNYIYLDEKEDIVKCISESYIEDIDRVADTFDKVLLYEMILNELYDSHVILTTNTDHSYRLSSPVYIEYKSNKYYIKNVFSSQLDNKFSVNLIGAEVLSFNGLDFAQAIEEFPTRCHNKNDEDVKEWLANKIISGKRNIPRKVALKLSNGNSFVLNMDELRLKDETTLMDVRIIDDIGIIRINNTLGNSDLAEEFKKSLRELSEVKALILDLRNTPGGGNTSVAEPIMSLFVDQRKGYQICENKQETYTKYIEPTDLYFSKPLIVLAGRWTGSMGEGMTIGFDGMKRATVVGTELNRLAGGIKVVNLSKSNFGFRISFEKMYHLNGELREIFVPQHYIQQSSVENDEYLHYALSLAGNM